MAACDKMTKTLQSLSSEHVMMPPSCLGPLVYPDLDFTVKKLLKGATTATRSTQIGYSAALGQVLMRLGSLLELKSLLELVHTECSLKNAVRKSEHSHFLQAKLLVMLQVVRAGLLETNPSVLSYFYDIVFDLMQKYSLPPIF